jgi:hypothetical protein
LATGGAGWVVWIGWRIATVRLHPIPIAGVLADIAGVASAGVLALSARHREFARAVDAARLLIVVAATAAGLLLGVSPLAHPPLEAVLALLAALAATTAAIVALGDGMLPGDRLRGGYAALAGLFANRRDGGQVRPWAATVAAVVVLNLAVALRGISDRWTHGLDPMDGESRTVAMTVAAVLVVVALYALATLTFDPEPRPRAHVRHHPRHQPDERSARRTAVAAAVCAGLIGLLAGVLPGSVDATHDDPARVEHLPQSEPSGAVGE